MMYHELNAATARDAPDDFLHEALNECRPDSGAYIAAKNEISRRRDNERNWRRVGVAVLLGLLTLAFWFLRSSGVLSG